MKKLKSILRMKRTWLAIGAITAALGAPSGVSSCIGVVSEIFANNTENTQNQVSQ